MLTDATSFVGPMLMHTRLLARLNKTIVIPLAVYFPIVVFIAIARLNKAGSLETQQAKTEG